MGQGERDYRKRVDAIAIQEGVHVPAGVPAAHTRTKKREQVLPVYQLALPTWPDPIPRRVFHATGTGAGHDKVGQRGLRKASSGSKGICSVSESIRDTLQRNAGCNS